MKFLVFLFLIAIQHLGCSQNTIESALIHKTSKDSAIVELQLSKTINESRMGLWKNGDYDIYVEISPLEQYLRTSYEDMIRAKREINMNDSVNLQVYKTFAQRYLEAANQLKEAQNGFDLRGLVLYIGNGNEEQKKGNSSIIDGYIKESVMKGDAAVFYKGERIYTLKRRTDADLSMSIIRIYKDHIDNCAYTYFGYINW
ncbi:MAG: hypothetical protein MUF75_09555 [Bacteroidia bacterium]|jgi:hypothetical protein|nr:hypothetical protein [Bacteroidia bacterium]